MRPLWPRLCCCDFYPRSPCGERLKDTTARQQVADISIHALLAESDRGADLICAHWNISIHALLAESDVIANFTLAQSSEFLSTLSLRRATWPVACSTAEPNFYPRSPCGERLQRGPRPHERGHFYPRSPCGERPAVIKNNTAFSVFLSTLSLRRATAGWAANGGTCCDFYPRSPCGERPYTMTIIICIALKFLSTLSLRRATVQIVMEEDLILISIHALLAESDCSVGFCLGAKAISIHALLAESDPPIRDIIQWEGIFLSTLSLRRATYGS